MLSCPKCKDAMIVVEDHGIWSRVCLNIECGYQEEASQEEQEEFEPEELDYNERYQDYTVGE